MVSSLAAKVAVGPQSPKLLAGTGNLEEDGFNLMATAAFTAAIVPALPSTAAAIFVTVPSFSTCKPFTAPGVPNLATRGLR